MVLEGGGRQAAGAQCGRLFLSPGDPHNMWVGAERWSATTTDKRLFCALQDKAGLADDDQPARRLHTGRRDEVAGRHGDCVQGRAWAWPDGGDVWYMARNRRRRLLNRQGSLQVLESQGPAIGRRRKVKQPTRPACILFGPTRSPSQRDDPVADRPMGAHACHASVSSHRQSTACAWPDSGS